MAVPEQVLLAPEPLFDPQRVGESLDTMLPISAPWLSGTRSGETTSRRRGEGFDIDGIRPYEIGDDPRYIDWKATARNPEGTPQYRMHQADITPSVWVLTDTLSSRYEVNAGSISEQMLAVSAIMSIFKTANKQGMPISMVAANNGRIYSPRHESAAPKQYLRLGHQISNLLGENKSGEDAEVTLTEVLTKASKFITESIVVVVSDFRDDIPSDNANFAWARPLNKIARNGNDLIAVEVSQPWDFQLPQKIETFMPAAHQTVNIADGDYEQEIRQSYANVGRATQAKIDETLREVKAGHIKLASEQSEWASSLRAQVRQLAKKAAGQ